MSSSRRVRPVPIALFIAGVVAALVLVVRELTVGAPGHEVRTGPAPITQFADDFSSRSGWGTSSSETLDLSYLDGGYELQLSRPADDGVSVLVLPGKGWLSVAATATVEARSPMGGLVGVGCAAGKAHAYLGAVDPATTGFVILRAGESGMTLLRYGASDEGTVRRVDDQNELQLQCSFRPGPPPVTSLRLFANGRLLGAYEDRDGFGPLNGVALGGVSLLTPLEALFKRTALQVLPDRGASGASSLCDHLDWAGSVEEDHAWLVDSGGTSVGSPDFDSRQVARIARELARISAALYVDARASGVPEEARRSLRTLASRVRAQGAALNSLTTKVSRRRIDVTEASSALSCPAPRFFEPRNRTQARLAGVPTGAKVARVAGVARELDERLTQNLPSAAFVSNTTLPLEPDPGVNVHFRHDAFRVFGESIAELNRSLRVNALHVEKELAAGVTSSRFEASYDPVPGASGCTLVPQVSLSLVITLPEWDPPLTADRYLRNQWNQFMWDLDAHERHHAELWIRAANRMIAAISGTPPGGSCESVVETAKLRVGQVFKRFDRLQRKFDRDVAAGRLPEPSLP